MRSVINISLSEDLAVDLEKAIRNGRYSSRSEFLRELIRERIEQEDLLKRVRISQKEIEKGKGKILKSLKDLR